jgi:hypothetical protein
MTELHLSAEQEAEAQVVFERLKGALEREALQLARLMASKEDRQVLGRTEFEVRDHVHRLGAQVLESVLQERKKKGDQGTSTSCPRCAEPARCVGYRGKTLVSLLGAVRVERPYYPCAACGQGSCPWDTVLGVTATALSPGAEEVACIAGVQSSFAEASTKVLPKLAGLQLAESTVERTTEATGGRLAAAQTAERREEAAQAWAWHKDAEGKTVADVAVDATGVPQQGREGAKAESRMANVAVLYNPVPADPARWASPAVGPEPTWQARYVASLERMAVVGAALRQQSVAVGMEQAERWIALSDGGTGWEVTAHLGCERLSSVRFSEAARQLCQSNRHHPGLVVRTGL